MGRGRGGRPLSTHCVHSSGRYNHRDANGGLTVRMILTGALVLTSPMSAVAQTAAASVPKLSTCEALAADWKRFDMNMADRFADGIGDNSAPRATLRAIEEGNDLLKANMTLQFIRDNKCPLPKSAPSGTSFISAALECSTQRLKVGIEAAKIVCDRANWVAK